MRMCKFCFCGALASLLALVTACDKAKIPGIGPAKEKMAKYRVAPIMRTDISRTVEATGTVTPRNSASGIPVGAQVNGKIIKLFVDYNSTVTNGQIVALIDPQVYEATYKSSIAQLEMNKANVAKCEAALVYAEKTYVRKASLVEKNLASVAELDAAIEARDTAKAQLASAKASVMQSEANVSQAKANLDYCTIVSPVDGIVIDRKVEVGETVVSSMNAVPVLTIAEDLKTIWVEATVPEADIGNVKIGQKVEFTVDAYRRKFHGKVKQIRRAATTTNNVVTFPVIIEATNPYEMLFPGMTATIAIETARVENVLGVSVAALRFRPRSEDLKAVGETPRGLKLWFARPDDSLEFVLVEEGVSDDSFIQVVPKENKELSLEGKQAIIGYETPTTLSMSKNATNNPFMPKRPQHGTKGTAPEPKK